MPRRPSALVRRFAAAVRFAAGQQQRVEPREARDRGDGDEVVAPEAADLTLDATLLVRALQARCRELRLEEVVRAQRDEASVSTRRRPLRTCLTADVRLSKRTRSKTPPNHSNA